MAFVIMNQFQGLMAVGDSGQAMNSTSQRHWDEGLTTLAFTKTETLLIDLVVINGRNLSIITTDCISVALAFNLLNWATHFVFRSSIHT